MSNFRTVAPSRAPLDPSKRVLYSHGLVLGVADFDQEQAYLMERDRRHQRGLHGYGTLCGLGLELRDDPRDGPELVVHAGLAVDRAGETLRVREDQCAPLNGWLARNRDRLPSGLVSPFSRLELEIELCAADCETDPVPIPGGPCRTQDDSIVASRIQDGYTLRLVPRGGFVTSPPSGSPPSGSPPSGSPPSGSPPSSAITEEEAVRAFGDLLARIIVDSTGPFSSSADLMRWVREIATGPLSPAGGPPAEIRLSPAIAYETLRAALLVWVTQVRPRVTADRCGARTPESCVSLGRVFLDVRPDFTVQLADVQLDEADRPFLLSTRLLQEWPLARLASGQTGGSLSPFGPAVIVAAGFFRPDGSSFGPPLNPSFTVTPLSDTNYRLSFAEYVDPTVAGGGTYIVKGTVGIGPGAAATSVELVGFQPNGIDIRRRPANRNFQIEVTAYGALVP